VECSIKSHVWWNMEIQMFLHYHTLHQIWIVKSNKITWNQNNKYMKWKSTLTIYNKLTKLDRWPLSMPIWKLLDQQMITSKRDKITESKLALIFNRWVYKRSLFMNPIYIITILLKNISHNNSLNLHNNNSLLNLHNNDSHSLSWREGILFYTWELWK